jgi:hypothetical protein
MIEIGFSAALHWMVRSAHVFAMTDGLYIKVVKRLKKLSDQYDDYHLVGAVLPSCTVERLAALFAQARSICET